MRLCIERVLPACRERAIKFALPPIESAADIAAAMKAVTSALADGAITPGEAATIAAVVDTFVRAIETSDFDRRLQLMEDGFASRAKAEAGAGPGMRFNLIPAVGAEKLALGGYQFDFCVQGQAACRRRGGSSWRPLRYLTRA
jgi:hypothetical protein